MPHNPAFCFAKVVTRAPVAALAALVVGPPNQDVCASLVQEPENVHLSAMVKRVITVEPV